LEWILIYGFVDISFLFDIIFTFFTSYTDPITNLEITSHKKIAINYMKLWFWFDVLSILPIDYFIMSSGTGSPTNVNSLLRFAKFSKIYKIIRLTRLAKVFKLLKNNKSIISKLTEKLRISNGIERLITFFCFFLIFVHVAACMFIVLAELQEGDYVSWVNNNEPIDGLDLYIMSIYFTLTTVSTVGYGDILPGTEWERAYCTLLMLVGVSAFTFISGALSSIISNYDQS
jgi:hypothetical protein